LRFGTSTCTECPSFAIAVSTPRATIRVIASSSASSQLTGTLPLTGVRPSASSAIRVHSTTLFAAGSPDATPATKGYAPGGSASARPVNRLPEASANAPAPPAASSSRRDIRLDIGLLCL
jgi:hypothetical protein